MLGTVIALVSSGRLCKCSTEPPAERDCQFGHCGLCQREPKVPGLYYKKHRNSTSYAQYEARTSEHLLERKTP